MLVGKKKTSKKCIGLYICLDAFYISQSAISGNKIKVERFAKIPIPKISGAEISQHISAMNVDFFLSEENWLKPLQNTINKIKLDTKDVVVTLSPSFAVIRHFVMPFVERRFWRQSIPFEAKKYIPFSLEESSYDYHVYRIKGEQNKNARLGVVFGLTDKKISSAITNGISKIGLDMIAMEVSAISAQRFLSIVDSSKSGGGSFWAHFDESSAYFLFSNNSVPLLFRVVNFGQSQMTERRRLGLRGSVDFLHKQLGAKIYSEIALSGLNLDFWKNVVAEDTKLKIKVWEPGLCLNMKNTDWGTYASLGAGARQMVPLALDVDIKSTVRENFNDKIAVSFLWKIAGILTAFVIALFLYSQAKTLLLSARVAKASKDTKLISELREFSASEIEQYISGLKDRLQIATTVTQHDNYFTPKLEAVVNSIPSSVWLKSITYSYPVRSDEAKSVTGRLVLSGHLSAKNKEEEIAIANEFKEIFQNENAIKSVYSGSSSRINLDYEASGETTVDGYSSFRITCIKEFTK